MQQIHVENIKEVLRNKSKLEKELKIKISNKGKIIFINGKADSEFLALKLLEAVNLGFSVEVSLSLKDEEIILQSINIKDLTKRNDLERIRARIIGTKGRTLKTLKNLTNCNFSLNDNQIGIIGDIDEIEDARQAIISIVQGSKQSNVYGRLERHRKNKRMQLNNYNTEQQTKSIFRSF